MFASEIVHMDCFEIESEYWTNNVLTICFCFWGQFRISTFNNLKRFRYIYIILLGLTADVLVHNWKL